MWRPWSDTGSRGGWRGLTAHVQKWSPYDYRAGRASHDRGPQRPSALCLRGHPPRLGAQTGCVCLVPAACGRAGKQRRRRGWGCGRERAAALALPALQQRPPLLGRLPVGGATARESKQRGCQRGLRALCSQQRGDCSELLQVPEHEQRLGQPSERQEVTRAAPVRLRQTGRGSAVGARWEHSGCLLVFGQRALSARQRRPRHKPARKRSTS